MASNSATVVPGAAPNTFPDWIELYNAGATSVDLSGWHLTDNASTLTKWTFPAGTVIEAGQYKIILANNGGVAGDTTNLTATFALSADGEYVGLVRPEANSTFTIVSEIAPTYPAMAANVSYGILNGGGAFAFTATPTPGAVNIGSDITQVSPVMASIKRGFFTSPFTVSLSNATAGAQIYYTIDSTPPLNPDGTPASTATLYTSPISVTTTTILRSAAIKSGSTPAAVDTQSYIFPAATATQTRPPNYPTTWVGESNADYNVDPAVSLSAEDAQRFQNGLRELPTVSVNLPVDDMFGPEGVYSLTFADLEKAVSAEYFKPASTGDGINAEPGFQIDCGIQLQGGASRTPGSAVKHSFSLRFRSSYGVGTLEYPLFKDSNVTSFSGGIHLRAMYNNSWIHSDAPQRSRATMITDQWMRDSHIAMGNPDGLRGHFVHLFINSLYWGVYNLHERPNDDHYSAYNNSDLNPDDLVGFNPGSATAEERANFQILRDTVQSGTWTQITQKMDIDNYIDYYLIQHFGHNDDLKSTDNWRAAGGGAANAPWRFYVWDAERSLENPSSTGSLAIHQDGPGFIDRLMTFPDFQTRFADRVWKHFHHGGVLSNENNRARFLARVAELDSAIVGESARWGDDRMGSGDYTRTAHWLKAVFGPLSVAPIGGVLGESGWFPETTLNRTTIFETAWKTQNWGSTGIKKIPSDPPAFAVNGTAKHGGRIPTGGSLSLTGGTGQRFVTTDGSDPRLTGGAIKPGLTPYSSGSIPLNSSSLVRTRWFDGTRWSALNEAFFLLEDPATTADIRIAEIHYHPAEPSPLEQLAGPFEADDFQFIEIVNIGTAPVNLIGASLDNGVTFTFGNTVLPAGGRAVVVENVQAFAARYGNAITPVGTWSGKLSGIGETIELKDATAAVAATVTYSDVTPWPIRADGGGSSLEIISPAASPSSASNWRASTDFHGSPNAAGRAVDGRIKVNEVLANPNTGGKDAIEIVNTTASSINLSNWFLTDGNSNYRKFRIPAGTVLQPGAYLVFDENQFNVAVTFDIVSYANSTITTITSNGHGLVTGDPITIAGASTAAYNGQFQVTVINADSFTIPVTFIDHPITKGKWNRGQTFGLSSSGEQVWILEGKAGSELVSFVDQIDFGTTVKGQTAGRWPDSAGPIAIMSTATTSARNSGPNGYDNWAAGFNLTGSDSDNDGIPDMGEYAMGLFPDQRNSLIFAKVGGNFEMNFSLVPSRTDVTTLLERSTTLSNPWEAVMSQVTGSTNGMEARKFTTPLADQPKTFYRFRFVR